MLPRTTVMLNMAPFQNRSIQLLVLLTAKSNKSSLTFCCVHNEVCDNGYLCDLQSSIWMSHGVTHGNTLMSSFLLVRNQSIVMIREWNYIALQIIRKIIPQASFSNLYWWGEQQRPKEVVWVKSLKDKQVVDLSTFGGCKHFLKAHVVLVHSVFSCLWLVPNFYMLVL